MTCKNCGADVPWGIRKCPKCHAEVDANLFLVMLRAVVEEVRKGTIQKNIKERRINIPVIAASLIAVIAQFLPIWKAELLGYSEHITAFEDFGRAGAMVIFAVLCIFLAMIGDQYIPFIFLVGAVYFINAIYNTLSMRSAISQSGVGELGIGIYLSLLAGAGIIGACIPVFKKYGITWNAYKEWDKNKKENRENDGK